jgi:hypothetical protein
MFLDLLLFLGGFLFFSCVELVRKRAETEGNSKNPPENQIQDPVTLIRKGGGTGRAMEGGMAKFSDNGGVGGVGLVEDLVPRSAPGFAAPHCSP